MADWIDISDLRPTQLTLGHGAVAERRAKLTAKSEAELDDYLLEEKRRVPHVRGPEGRIYMTDHHHLARALWEMGKKKIVLGKMLRDFSELPPNPDPRAKPSPLLHTFWCRMDEEKLCWPVDTEGNRRPFSAIPDHISKLGDNPWRTLARTVRDKAFVDDDTAFQEFMWGEYFRSFMTRRLVDEQPEIAAKTAIKVGALPDAQDLPGYKG